MEYIMAIKTALVTSQEIDIYQKKWLIKTMKIKKGFRILNSVGHSVGQPLKQWRINYLIYSSGSCPL